MRGVLRDNLLLNDPFPDPSNKELPLNLDFLQPLRILRDMNISDLRRFIVAALHNDIIFHKHSGMLFGEGNKKLEFSARPIAPRPDQRSDLFDDPLKYHIGRINV